MSLEVIKSGMADTFQDAGRFGHQHVGINPNGAMDLIAMNVANALAGNDFHEPVLELCFPASTLLCKKPSLIALSGANFTGEINGTPIPINKTIAVPAGSELNFKKTAQGVFGYLAVHGGFSLTFWLGSFSTNMKANAGGWKGRFLKKGDTIDFKKTVNNFNEIRVLPWRANVSEFYSNPEIIRIIRGNELAWLDESSKKKLAEGSFIITPLRDRMGYRLKGESLTRNNNRELISTAATFGTVQLLPDGQLIILMADHQTTGGYPRVGQVIGADRSKLVQCAIGSEIKFYHVTIQEGEDLLISQHKTLRQIQLTCADRLGEFLKSVHEY